VSVLKKYFLGDSVLWIITLLLLLLSIPAVYSASAMISHKSYHGDMHFLVRQISAVAFALLVIFIVSRINYKLWLKLIKFIFPIIIVILLFTLLTGVSHNDAKRWFLIPLIGIEVQTSELAKIALIIFVAASLATKRNDAEVHDSKVKIAVWTSVLTIGLIFPADLSSALMILVIIGIVMFIGSVQLKKIYKIILIAGAAFVVYMLIAEAYHLPGRLSTWTHRIEVFLGDDTELHSDETYQLDISKMAIVNGGFRGQGPGNGTVRYLLPQSHSDFIFAFIVEEYGFFMALFIISLYGALFYRGIRIARKTGSLFAAYLAIGLTVAIVMQALINIGVSVGALPVTGQTLPLISMGRTSLFVTSFSIGVIINISKMTDVSDDAESNENVN